MGKKILKKQIRSSQLGNKVKIKTALFSLFFRPQDCYYKNNLKFDFNGPCLFQLTNSSTHSLQIDDWCSSYSNALNGTLVRSTTDSEKPVLAPVASPAVLHDPVFLPGLMALPIPHQQHRMVGQLKWIVGVTEASVMVDALFVGHEIWVDLQCHTHGAVPDQLQHHGRLAASAVKPTHVVIIGGVVPSAFLGYFAGRIIPSVRETVLLHNAEVLDVFTNQIWKTSITTCTEDNKTL